MIIVPQKEIKIKKIRFYAYPLALFSIYNMFWVVLLLDIALWLYQNIYFAILEIPRIKRSDYLVLDRNKLSKLSLSQRINCIYCEYVNGILAYAKAVGGQTEIYSCAIKHLREANGQDHQQDFYDYNQFV